MSTTGIKTCITFARTGKGEKVTLKPYKGETIKLDIYSSPGSTDKQTCGFDIGRLNIVYEIFL